MGNQQSSPSPPATPPPPVSPPPPPLPPPCDLECQKQKKLVTLKQDLDSKDPEKDPEGYEKARIAYYTLLNGPGWLMQEKHRIAKEEVEPVTASYQQQYDALNGEKQTQSIFTNLSTALKAQEQSDQASNDFLNKQLQTEKDKAQTLDRMVDLGGSPTSYSWVSWVIDIIITLLAIFVGYKVYSRFFASTSVNPVPDLTST
jgi:hypothetical protein